MDALKQMLRFFPMCFEQILCAYTLSVILNKLVLLLLSLIEFKSDCSINSHRPNACNAITSIEVPVGSPGLLPFWSEILRALAT